MSLNIHPVFWHIFCMLVFPITMFIHLEYLHLTTALIRCRPLKYFYQVFLWLTVSANYIVTITAHLVIQLWAVRPNMAERCLFYLSFLLFHPPQTPPSFPCLHRWLPVTRSFHLRVLRLCVRGPCVFPRECVLSAMPCRNQHVAVDTVPGWPHHLQVRKRCYRQTHAATAARVLLQPPLTLDQWRIWEQIRSNGAESFLMPFLSARQSEEEERQTLSASSVSVCWRWPSADWNRLHACWLG